MSTAQKYATPSFLIINMLNKVFSARFFVDSVS